MEKTKLFKALSDFQTEVPVIHKGTKGYGYSYSDLPTIFGVINPLLKKHGLGFTQLVNGQSIKTIVFHVESGETIESNTNIPENVTLKGMNDFQVLGSAISYLRRYSISSILCLVTDKDTDASGKQPDVTLEALHGLYVAKKSVIPHENVVHIERIINEKEFKNYKKTYNYLKSLK